MLASAAPAIAASFGFAARSIARAAVAPNMPRSVSVRLIDSFNKELVDDIFAHALKKQTGVSLKYMLDFGANPIERQLLLSAQFLHKELPVRLAHRVAELENLPYGLSAKKAILQVRDWYVESFKELRSFPAIRDAGDELRFTEMLRGIYRRHANAVPVMAKGVGELREELRRQQCLSELPEIHQFLDGFYLSRIGIRILIGQHIALHEPPKPNHIGLICTRCSPLAVAQDAINDARSICMREYGDAPEVTVYGSPDFTFPYVPSHLHHMLFELVKNSLRAVQDRFSDSDDPAPPIRLVVAEGGEDVTLKVSDEGGGIPRSGLANIWTYLYSTAKSDVSPPEPDLLPSDSSYRLLEQLLHQHQLLSRPHHLQHHPLNALTNQPPQRPPRPSRPPPARSARIIPTTRIYPPPLHSSYGSPVDVRQVEEADSGPVVLAGYGYGLPISRLYARYFGGDLQIISMEGYGTDAYLHLNRLGTSQEPLP